MSEKYYFNVLAFSLVPSVPMSDWKQRSGFHQTINSWTPFLRLTCYRTHRLPFFILVSCYFGSHSLIHAFSRKTKNTNLDRKLKSYNRTSSLEGTGLPTGVLASPIGSELSSFASYSSLYLFYKTFRIGKLDDWSILCPILCRKDWMVLRYRRQSGHWEGARIQKMIRDETAKFPKLFQESIFTGS